MQVQALEELWKQTSPEEIPPEPDPALPRRRGAGELLDMVIDILPELPVLFTKNDIDKALKEPVDRASVFRALRDLEEDGWTQTEKPGRGRKPTVYRQLESEDGDETV